MACHSNTALNKMSPNSDSFFSFFQGSFHSGRSKVARVTVGRDVDQSFRVCKVNLATLEVALKPLVTQAFEWRTQAAGRHGCTSSSLLRARICWAKGGQVEFAQGTQDARITFTVRLARPRAMKSVRMVLLLGLASLLLRTFWRVLDLRCSCLWIAAQEWRGGPFLLLRRESI